MTRYALVELLHLLALTLAVLFVPTRAMRWLWVDQSERYVIALEGPSKEYR